jgi:predicted metal-dependent phosphoesterase TrpH
MNLIDLHTHSSASDGSLAPGEVVTHAVQKGAAAIALTDHDTVAGLPEALRVAEASHFELVPGLEISAAYTGGGMHILGYFIDHADPFLQQELEHLQQARRERNPKIIVRLRELGIPITYDQVLALSGGQIGRPHIAQAMLQIGAVQTLDEAFKHYLTKGAPAYVEKFRFPPARAISLIRRAGGIPVLAHPFTLNCTTGEQLIRLLRELKEQGLQGLECLYSEHTPEQTREYLTLAEKLDLLVTGGSDFHGRNKEGVEVLTGYGALRIPYDRLQSLKDLKARH